jgi:hypothetical protein
MRYREALRLAKKAGACESAIVKLKQITSWEEFRKLPDAGDYARWFAVNVLEGLWSEEKVRAFVLDYARVINRKYWGVSLNDEDPSSFYYKLGNWTDAGWYWDGNSGDGTFLLFLFRLVHSKVLTEFKDTIVSYTWILRSMDAYLKQAVKDSEEREMLLYGILGDNVYFRFGGDESEPDTDYYIDEYLIPVVVKDLKLTEEEVEKFRGRFEDILWAHYSSKWSVDLFLEEGVKRFDKEFGFDSIPTKVLEFVNYFDDDDMRENLMYFAGELRSAVIDQIMDDVFPDVIEEAKELILEERESVGEVS